MAIERHQGAAGVNLQRRGNKGYWGSWDGPEIVIGRCYLGRRQGYTARLRKRVNWGSNRSLQVPTGPLRCLVTITSVMPRSGVSGL